MDIKLADVAVMADDLPVGTLKEGASRVNVCPPNVPFSRVICTFEAVLLICTSVTCCT